MTIITKDKKYFYKGNDTSLANEEIENINKVITESEEMSKKAAEDFINSLSD